LITSGELIRLCKNKKVFIWGAMIVGQGVCRSLERIGIPVESFIDSSPSLQGGKALGYAVGKPGDAIELARSEQGLIIASSGHCDLDIGESCKRAGLRKGKDYILCRELNDIDPSVDVAGICNLRCISCPRGNEDIQPPKGFMSAITYRKVLDKLLKEIPLLGSIQLYTWGEPLLNPELPEIIGMTREAGVLTAISSNLNYSKHLAPVVAARPDWFKVSCSGWEETYELTHTGGKWNIFIANLRKLSRFRDETHPEMQITLNYHLYKHNTGEDYRRMEALCEELSLIFRPSPAYLYPVDTVLDFIEGRNISGEAQKTLSMLLTSLDEGMEKARERSHLPCPEERCFPINWDCSVRECGVFFRPFIAGNYLDTPIAEIIEKKKKSGLCARCRKHGLHQFTGVYLAEKRINEGDMPHACLT
jgi:MoaA/NifB/PqqE/SkfB family radical SAM enzyme